MPTSFVCQNEGATVAAVTGSSGVEFICGDASSDTSTSNSPSSANRIVFAASSVLCGGELFDTITGSPCNVSGRPLAATPSAAAILLIVFSFITQTSLPPAAVIAARMLARSVAMAAAVDPVLVIAVPFAVIEFTGYVGVVTVGTRNN